MSVIRRNQHLAHGQTGQTIYQTMLIISCIALAVAVFFPAFEFIQDYKGPSAPAAEEPPPASQEPAPADTVDAAGDEAATEALDEALETGETEAAD